MYISDTIIEVVAYIQALLSSFSVLSKLSAKPYGIIEMSKIQH